MYFASDRINKSLVKEISTQKINDNISELRVELEKEENQLKKLKEKWQIKVLQTKINQITISLALLREELARRNGHYPFVGLL